MAILTILGALYLTIGTAYAIYILIKGTAPWYYFPINLLGGPIIMVYVIYVTLAGKDLPTEF